MPSAADWITLAEAAEILAAANVRFRPDDDRRLGAVRAPVEHQARRPAVRPAGRGPGAGRRAAPRPRRGHPARPVRGPELLIVMSAHEADERSVARIRALAERIADRVGGLPAVRTLAGGPRGVRPGRRRAGRRRARLRGPVRPAARPAAAAVGLRPRRRGPGRPGRSWSPRSPTRFRRSRRSPETALEPGVGRGRSRAGIIALVGLLWGSSRFYSALDYAHGADLPPARRTGTRSSGRCAACARDACWSRSRSRSCSPGAAVQALLDLLPDAEHGGGHREARRPARDAGRLDRAVRDRDGAGLPVRARAARARAGLAPAGDRRRPAAGRRSPSCSRSSRR